MLSEMTDILDHLEASGNVPAGWGRGFFTNRWRPQFCTNTGLSDGESVRVTEAIATASLCHTIEGVLAGSEGDVVTFEYVHHTSMWHASVWVEGGYGIDGEENGEWRASDPCRLSAAAALYRTVFNLETPDA